MDPKVVTSIEGSPTSGPFLVTPRIAGDRMTMLEVRVERGVRSQTHAHSHESLIYVVSGALETRVDHRRLVLRTGDVCTHPENVGHSIKALEDSVFIEIKAPPPELKSTLGI